MKRTFLKFKTVAVVLITICVLLNSCKKEVIYNPEQRIRKIYNNASKDLWQEWNWKDNRLASILYYNNYGFPCIEFYHYKNDKLVKVEDRNGYYQISYSNSRYKKIEYFNNEERILGTWDFSYRNNKVYQINFKYSDSYLIDKVKEGGFLSSLIAKEFIPVFESAAKGKTEKFVTFTYKYNGNNIKEQKAEFADMEDYSTIVYKSYDTKQNPFYRRIDLHTDLSSYPELFHLIELSSKNNPLEVECYHNESLIITLNYSYIYDKMNFPIEVKGSFVIDQMWHGTFETYYEYE